MKRQPNRSRGKATKRRRPVRPSKDKFVPPRTVEEFFAMSTHDQALWKNVTQAVTEVRAGVSLRRASRKFGVWSPSRFPRCASTNVQSGNSALRPGEEKAHACDNACSIRGDVKNILLPPPEARVMVRGIQSLVR